jgi:hypothetical protein
VENLLAADRTIDRVHELLQKLRDFSEMGIERAGIRSFPCGHYLVFYWPGPDGITVVRIVSGRRDLETLEYPRPSRTPAIPLRTLSVPARNRANGSDRVQVPDPGPLQAPPLMTVMHEESELLRTPARGGLVM